MEGIQDLAHLVNFYCQPARASTAPDLLRLLAWARNKYTAKRPAALSSPHASRR